MPAADEVGRLQRGDDQECRLFQRLAEQGHFAGRSVPSTTRQGIYAAAPSGVLLASINSGAPRAVADVLERALARWEELPESERLLPGPPIGGARFDARAGAPPRRWEDLRPEDGLVLRVVARDVERGDGPDDWRAHAWNQDHAWFTREEALALVPAEARVGAELVWPAELALRLACCHLVDDVRGQVPAFRREEVERAELRTRVEAADGDRLELELSGRTRASAHGRWPVHGFEDAAQPAEQTRGFETELLGRATFDRAAQRFTRFELVAIGTRWGGTQFNGRFDDLAPAPVGVSLTLAVTDQAGRVAPARIAEYGWKPP